MAGPSPQLRDSTALSFPPLSCNGEASHVCPDVLTREKKFNERDQYDAANGACAYRKLGVGGLGTLEKLPSELIQLAVDQLIPDPHALAGFAATTRLAMEFANRSLVRLVPSSQQTTSSRLGEWTAQFRTLAPNMRKVLRRTSGLLPCPDIYARIDEDTYTLHFYIDVTRKHARTGETDLMERTFAHASAMAEKNGIGIAGMSAIRKEGYASRFHRYLAAARWQAQSGNAATMETCLTWVAMAAEKADIAMPDVRAMRNEGYANQFHTYLAAARKHAQAGWTEVTERCLAGAAEAAEKAGIPMPDVAAIKDELAERRASSPVPLE